MKKKIVKTSDENEPVTKGFLRHELDQFATKHFVKHEIEKSTNIILAELGNMRKENQEFHQMREQLYSNDVSQEQEIKNLKGRVIKLELRNKGIV